MSVSAHSLSPTVREQSFHRLLHPLHVFLLGAADASLVGGLLSDLAYFSTQEIQWKNFTSWLVMSGLVFMGFALLWALIDLLRGHHDRRRLGIYFLLLLAAWILGFVNELIHAKDAWASMPDALVISGIVAVLAIAATWLGLSAGQVRGS